MLIMPENLYKAKPIHLDSTITDTADMEVDLDSYGGPQPDADSDFAELYRDVSFIL